MYQYAKYIFTETLKPAMTGFITANVVISGVIITTYIQTSFNNFLVKKLDNK